MSSPALPSERPFERPGLDALFDEALTAARGSSWPELMTLIQQIIASVRTRIPPGALITIMWPMQERLTDQQRLILDDLTLTPDRVRRFAEPFYFDHGVPSPRPISDLDAAASLATHAWSSYYP